MTSQHDSLEIELIRGELQKCISCGNCLHQCPVYAQEGEEMSVARGRNRALKEARGDIRALEPGFAERFGKCLLCGGCTVVCPQGVNNDLITIAARNDQVARHGLPTPKAFAFRTILKSRGKMRRALRVAEKVQKLLPVSRPAGKNLEGGLAEQPGKVRHLPHFLAGQNGGRHLPSIARKSLSQLVPEDNPPAVPADAKGIRVAYFSGCAVEFCMPSAGQALIRNLTRLGAQVVFPRDQGCCGLPVYASGDLEMAAELAAHNLEVLTELDADFVVTGCATCGSTMKKGWIALARNDQERTRYQELAAKVRDVSELILELADYKPLPCRPLLPPGAKVTYHNPCHLVRHQKVIEQPHRVLKQVYGDNFVEMDNNGCCGCGGLFSASHYGLSQKIGAQKIDSIERSGADVVVTSCPGCMIQLIDGIQHRGLKTKVMDIMEAMETVVEV